MTHKLPDLFEFSDGSRVRTPDDWRRRRTELLELLQEFEYGHMPPPAPVEGELLMRNFAGEYKARQFQYRLSVGHSQPGGQRPVSFILDVFVPEGPGIEGPFPVVVDGDACWPILSGEIAREVVGRGYALAWFNRLEVATDNKATGRQHGIFDLYPGGDYGTLAAWAWAYSRAIDFLLTLPFVRADQIIATGASRGGKTALLAGALDERIALTAPNDSGCCGAGCFRFLGPQSETLQEMIDHAGFWLSPRLREFLGREHELPFDQHALKAAVAPRLLVTTEALGDLYANGPGTWLTHAAAREAYRFLGVEDRIGIVYREGRHAHLLADWQALLDFADLHFRRRPAPRRFDLCPFKDLPQARDWSAPT
ncbi:MAG: hypothetical protein PHU85_16475 [Phycisphaerae bacterium]|nr:hypothetical protein [Phycisphaerae bacterium]